jgi:hypothetical protein
MFLMGEVPLYMKPRRRLCYSFTAYKMNSCSEGGRHQLGTLARFRDTCTETQGYLAHKKTPPP